MSISKPYFPVLDFIRGIAAFFVMLYHLQHWLQGPGYAVNAGLAVDLFFCLSGFVLASAYEQRFAAGMSLSDFVVSRLIRLMPLVLVATILSAAYVAARSHRGIDPVSQPELVIASVLNLFSIPFFGASHAIGGPQLFPLNGPQYTIWLELFANVVWFFTNRIRWRGLNYVIVIASFVGLTQLGIGGDVEGTFWSGVPRVLFSFYAGVILFSVFGRPRPEDSPALHRSAFAAFFGIMVVLFALPLPYQLPFSLELVWIVLLSPALVATAASIRVEGRLFHVSAWLGAISYPVYILHYPIFCWVNGVYRTVFATNNFMAETAIMAVVLPIASTVALRLFDEPVRSLFAGWRRRARLAHRPST